MGILVITNEAIMNAYEYEMKNFSTSSLSYKSAHNAYTENHFDIRGEDANVLGFLFHGKTTLDMDETCRHPAVVALLQSLKNE